LRIHRDRGDLAQGIRNRREVALGVVPERGGVAQRIGDGRAMSSYELNACIASLLLREKSYRHIIIF
jgi:hypothetical protein